MTKPVVAIVGRPNVGKSALFNRILGRNLAIVEDMPGVTRDRNYADAEWDGKQFHLIDTGGFEPESEDPMFMKIREQTTLAIEEADYMSDLIVLLSARPGTVSQVIRPGIDRSGNCADDIRRDKKYLDVVDKIWSELKVYLC